MKKGCAVADGATAVQASTLLRGSAGVTVVAAVPGFGGSRCLCNLPEPGFAAVMPIYKWVTHQQRILPSGSNLYGVQTMSSSRRP